MLVLRCCLSLFVSVCLYLPLCLSVSPSVCQSVWLAGCLALVMPIHLSRYSHVLRALYNAIEIMMMLQWHYDDVAVGCRELCREAGRGWV